jgi:hypothetical protein
LIIQTSADVKLSDVVPIELKKNINFSGNGKALDLEVILKEGIRFINFVDRVKGGLTENY